jgi:hypothetical protein
MAAGRREVRDERGQHRPTLTAERRRNFSPRKPAPACKLVYQDPHAIYKSNTSVPSVIS